MQQDFFLRHMCAYVFVGRKEAIEITSLLVFILIYGFIARKQYSMFVIVVQFFQFCCYCFSRNSPHSVYSFNVYPVHYIVSAAKLDDVKVNCHFKYYFGCS